MTWDDIGCDYGDVITVETRMGDEYTGLLVDF